MARHAPPPRRSPLRMVLTVCSLPEPLKRQPLAPLAHLVSVRRAMEAAQQMEQELVKRREELQVRLVSSMSRH